MRTRYIVATIVALALGAAALGAAHTPTVHKIPGLVTAATPDPPTPQQRLDVQNDMKQLQLYQQQVQIINFQFEQTKAALQQKLKALERDGWDLNLETWTYVPKGSAPPTPIAPPGK